MSFSVDVSQQIPPLKSIPNGGWPLVAQGIPGLISGDAIIQASVANIQQEIQQADSYALNTYNGQVYTWKQNNAKGIYSPAPDAVNLAGVIPSAMSNFLATGIADPQPIYYYTQFDPSAPPGTVLSPTPPPAPNTTLFSSLTLGTLVPGTFDMYTVEGGIPTVNEIGQTATFNGSTYMLVPESPFNLNNFFWKKQ